MTNEEVRRSMSFGIGSPQDRDSMKITVTHREPSYGHGGIPQSWDMVVQELFSWPHSRQKLAAKHK